MIFEAPTKCRGFYDKEKTIMAVHILYIKIVIGGIPQAPFLL